MTQTGRRTKTPKTVLAFASTEDAMAIDAAAPEHGLPGRLIPVPSEIDAGCGFAWAADAREGEELLRRVDELGLSYESVHEVMMY